MEKISKSLVSPSPAVRMDWLSPESPFELAGARGASHFAHRLAPVGLLAPHRGHSIGQSLPERRVSAGKLILVPTKNSVHAVVIDVMGSVANLRQPCEL